MNSFISSSFPSHYNCSQSYFIKSGYIELLQLPFLGNTKLIVLLAFISHVIIPNGRIIVQSTNGALKMILPKQEKRTRL